MKDNILNLINKNKWDDIYNILKKDNTVINTKINDNYLIHIACANNNFKIIKYIVKNDYINFQKLDGNNNTCLYILLSYGYIDTLKYILKNYNKLINHTDDNNNTIINHIINTNNIKLLKWVIDNITNINFNIVNSEHQTPLTNSIINGYDDISLLLLNQNIDLELPKKYPPLFLASLSNNDKLVENLLKKNVNVNQKTKNYKTALISAINNNNFDITKMLIENGANINYSGPEGDDNPLINSIINNNDDIINLLLNNNANIDMYNKYKESPLHVAINSNISNELIFRLLYNGNLNIQNIDGETPLHFLLKNENRWKYYENALINNKLDIFVENQYNKKPIDYISNEKLPEFIDVVVKSYINSLNKNNQKNFKFERKFQKIKKKIFEEKKSFISDSSNNNLKIINAPNTNIGIFNSDTFHNIIYTIIILKRNKNLFIPFQYLIKDKMNNDLYELHYNNMFRGRSNIITEMVQLYTQFFYELSPYVILWKNNDEFFIHKNMELLLNKCLNSLNTRFIYIKLSLISSSYIHANILLFDKETCIIERFEPYGIVPHMDTYKFDELFVEKLGHIFKNYAKKNNKKFKYLSPKNYMENISFQTLSNDSDKLVKKMGDPIGYCLAWTFWYIENRIQNPDIAPNDLVKNSINFIINDKNNNSEGEYKFIDFIRNYAFKLNKEKDQFLLNSGIDKNNIYNIVYSIEDHNKLISHCINSFMNLVKEKY